LSKPRPIGIIPASRAMTTMTGSSQKLGEILVKAGILAPEQLEDALRFQKETGQKIGECLVHLGHVRAEDVTRALARQAGLQFVDVRRGTIPPEVLALIPKDVALANNVLPVKAEGRNAIIAVTDPLAVFNIEHLRFLLNLDFKCALTTEEAMVDAFKRYFNVDKKEAKTIGDAPRRAQAAAKVDDDAPIIRLVQQVFEDALRLRASDIHIEPMADRVRIRLRIDGVLRTVADYPKHLQPALISRVKVIGEMEIAEKRKPQDGRINLKALGKEVDVRVSALPATHGESIVMRLLDKTVGLVSLERLGVGAEDLKRFRRIIRRPNGILLVTGPTGSGKTTTLYAALQELNKPSVKIITAENPVEYHLAGINQCQVRHQIGLDFVKILRAMLRQAPNIILVGEIRDKETASIAIQAALTGHLVFSTLHTNDAPSALTRLIDMGVPPFLVSSAVCAVLAQRLMRQLCPRCKVVQVPDGRMLASAGLDEQKIRGRTLYAPKGCDDCSGSGFRGRFGIYELFEMSSDMREATFRKEPTYRLRELARTSGNMMSLREDAIRKVLTGQTSLDEVLRVLSKESVGGDETGGEEGSA
jgi:type IV pilus assembly protein PilB